MGPPLAGLRGLADGRFHAHAERTGKGGDHGHGNPAATDFPGGDGLLRDLHRLGELRLGDAGTLAEFRDARAHRLGQAEKEEFQQLARAIGGWVAFDPEDADDRAAFVPFADWTARFEVWLEKASQAQRPNCR